MKKDNGPERFVNIAQFRGFAEGELNNGHLAQVLHFEAAQPGQSLKKVLKEKILFGNFGTVGRHELRPLAGLLFTGDRYQELLRDNCLGYTPEEVAQILEIVAMPDPAPDVAPLLGYIAPVPRRW